MADIVAAGVVQLAREGDTAKLICNNVQRDVANCKSTTWVFVNSTSTLEVVTLGEVKGNLKLLEDCSLLIPKVRALDAGRYVCQQFRSGIKQLEALPMDLSVVSCEYWYGGKPVGALGRPVTLLPPRQ